MKKIISLAFAGALAMGATAGNYKITIGFPDATLNNATAYLTSYDTGDTLATATVHGKRCVMKGTVDNSYFARLIVDGKRIGMVVEDGNVAVDFATGMATGAPQNDYINALEEKLNNAKSEEEYMSQFYNAYQENKDNGVGRWAYFQYLMAKVMEGKITYDEVEKELASLPAEYREMKRMKGVLTSLKAQDATKEGQMFADFTVTCDDGSQKKLSDYVGKGSYTLVDFWASWCGPCRREIPNIKAMYDKYNGKGMNFLGVAVWDAPADTHKAMDQLQIPWPVIVGDKKISHPTDLYGILGIPHIIVFDPEGRIISRSLQGQKLTDFVDSCFAK